jgi:hypothetical protein
MRWSRRSASAAGRGRRASCIIAIRARSTCRCARPTGSATPASRHLSAAAAPTTSRSPSRRLGSSRRRSFRGWARGARSRASNLRAWAGSAGSTRHACSNRLATCCAMNTKRAAMRRHSSPESHQSPSDQAGTVHDATWSGISVAAPFQRAKRSLVLYVLVPAELDVGGVHERDQGGHGESYTDRQFNR